MHSRSLIIFFVYYVSAVTSNICRYERRNMGCPNVRQIGNPGRLPSFADCQAACDARDDCDAIQINTRTRHPKTTVCSTPMNATKTVSMAFVLPSRTVSTLNVFVKMYKYGQSSIGIVQETILEA